MYALVGLVVRSQRSWREFVVGISLPKAWSEGEQRVFTNLLYYRCNYLLIALGIVAFRLYGFTRLGVSLLRVYTVPLSVCACECVWLYAMCLSVRGDVCIYMRMHVH